MDVGELKLERTYQVIPPAKKTLEDGRIVEYELLLEKPPATISLDWLLSELLKLGITFSGKTKANPKQAAPKEKAGKGYGQAALASECSVMAGTAEGGRNAQLNVSALKMGQLIASGDLTEDEVIVALTDAALLAGLGMGEAGKTIYSGLGAGIKKPREKAAYETPNRYGDEIGESEPTTAPPEEEDITPEERLRRLSIWLNAARTSKNKNITPDMISEVEERIAELEELINNPPPAEIVVKAGNNILKQGKVLKFLVQQAQRNHFGDEGVLKILLASIAATNSAKSRGIFPDINGPPGGGKSDAALAAIFLVADKWKSITSISSKALFYDDEMKDGMIIYSDDIEYSRELTATLKRSKGDFQHRQMHTVVNSVDGERKAEHKEMPCRIAWWLSSVESAADDQLKDRDYALDIGESAEHAEHVTDFINASRASSVVPGNADWRIGVARYIINQIKDHEIFRVKADFATRIEWSLKKDHRSQNKFWDLVDAFTILNYQQRVTDEDGWLHATKEDFEEAKTCFLIRKMSHTTKLTNAQITLIQKVAALEGVDGVTQAMLADELHRSQQAISLTMKSILGTPYITCEKGAFGENRYHTTKIGLDYAYSSVKEIVVLMEEAAA